MEESDEEARSQGWSLRRWKREIRQADNADVSLSPDSAEVDKGDNASMPADGDSDDDGPPGLVEEDHAALNSASAFDDNIDELLAGFPR